MRRFQKNGTLLTGVNCSVLSWAILCNILEMETWKYPITAPSLPMTSLIPFRGKGFLQHRVLLGGASNLLQGFIFWNNHSLSKMFNLVKNVSFLKIKNE
jgi:hypothetical protein